MTQSQEWFFGTVALLGSWALAWYLGWRARGRFFSGLRIVPEPHRPQFWDQEVEDHPSVRMFYDRREA